MADTLTAPDVEHIEGVDEAPACQTVRFHCDDLADWIVRGRCPNCRRSLITGGPPAAFMCDRHLTAWLDALGVRRTWSCPECRQPISNIPALLHWQRIR